MKKRLLELLEDNMIKYGIYIVPASLALMLLAAQDNSIEELNGLGIYMVVVMTAAAAGAKAMFTELFGLLRNRNELVALQTDLIASYKSIAENDQQIHAINNEIIADLTKQLEEEIE